MFLNNLKNKLQSDTIPILIKNGNKSFELSSENNATFNLNDKFLKNTLISGRHFELIGNIKNLMNIITIFQLSVTSLNITVINNDSKPDFQIRSNVDQYQIIIFSSI